MNWNTIITTLLTSCIPAIISYLVATNKSKSELNLFKEQSKSEIEKMKYQHESEIERLKIQSEIKSQSALDEVALNFFNDIVSGKRTINDLKNIKAIADEFNSEN
ncbi:hypothetical protein [Eremococcus coleocola]|uniref:hypothetical protein n=1 Tax=Eremococcus coleocola TaxID=88132 RepID=UPI0006868B15|nr:hypothetical protein [Eremococcus coleocola]